MNPEILVKLKELELLIQKERNPEDKTMVDFFRPVASKMVNTMKWKVLNYINNTLKDRFVDDKSYLSNIVHSAFNNITPEFLLEHAGGTYEESLWMGEVKDRIRNNQLLQAVKIYKDNTGLGLKECKDYVDMLKEQILKDEI